ncbi:MAG: GMP synthase (glutamine-hydrolyzing), partial [Acetoanaerobium sp.]|nr:GMP synthase (glutamine-hydrolyzing) [Acetoanaerobium sp.]
MKHETVLIIDFGGQYNQLIARRVREAKVYCEIVPYKKAIDKINEVKPEGIIFTGGPSSVNDPGAPDIEAEIFDLGIPILGICYGAQLTAKVLGGSVTKPEKREYGKTEINYAG